MDLSLPGISGLEAIRRIIRKDENAKILVFSIHEDTVFVDQAGTKRDNNASAMPYRSRKRKNPVKNRPRGDIL